MSSSSSSAEPAPWKRMDHQKLVEFRSTSRRSQLALFPRRGEVMKSFLTRRSLLISLLSPTHSHPPPILGTKNHLIFVFSPCGAAALTTGRGQSLIRSVEARGGGGGGGGGGRDTAAPHAALDRRLLFVRGLCQAAVHRGDQTKSEGVLCRLDLLDNICVA